MNKFINTPDSPSALMGCLFWVVFLAVGTALVWATLIRVTGLVL